MQDYFDPKDEMLLANVDALAEYLEDENKKEQVINPDRMTEFIRAIKILMSITQNKKIKVSYRVNEPYIGMGTVSLVGKSIAGLNEEVFSGVASTASNIDVFPRDDGTVQCDLTFHGLTNLIE